MARYRKSDDTRQGHRAYPVLKLVEPRVPTTVPDPPKGLLKSSQEHWRVFWASPVAAAVVPTDHYALERWIEAVDEYTRVGAIFRKNRIVEGSQGQPTLNPLSQYLKQLAATISRIESAYGMTPLARLRLGVVFGKAALTAADLNKALADEMEQDGAQTVDGEWVQG